MFYEDRMGFSIVQKHGLSENLTAEPLHLGPSGPSPHQAFALMRSRGSVLLAARWLANKKIEINEVMFIMRACKLTFVSVGKSINNLGQEHGTRL